jgi:hypothetical protein
MVCGKQVTTSVGSGMLQKYTVFPLQMQKQLRRFAQQGGNILVSGAYIGTDLSESIFPVQKDSTFAAGSRKFAAEVLGYKHQAGQASRTGYVRAVRNQTVDFSGLGTITFHNIVNPECYSVESPDGIVPACASAQTVLRYSDSGISAGVGYEADGHKAVSLGFPIEVLHNEEDIYNLINITLDFFKK